MTYVTAASAHNTKFYSFNPLKWLLRLEYAYRQAQQLKSTEDHHLRDMGISRRQANAAFYTQFKENRWYSRAR